jgi:hypothetical protein
MTGALVGRGSGSAMTDGCGGAGLGVVIRLPDCETALSSQAAVRRSRRKSLHMGIGRLRFRDCKARNEDLCVVCEAKSVGAIS